jgi:hypothetical protein
MQQLAAAAPGGPPVLLTAVAASMVPSTAGASAPKLRTARCQPAWLIQGHCALQCALGPLPSLEPSPCCPTLRCSPFRRCTRAAQPASAPAAEGPAADATAVAQPCCQGCVVAAGQRPPCAPLAGSAERGGEVGGAGTRGGGSGLRGHRGGTDAAVVLMLLLKVPVQTRLLAFMSVEEDVLRATVSRHGILSGILCVLGRC